MTTKPLNWSNSISRWTTLTKLSFIGLSLVGLIALACGGGGREGSSSSSSSVRFKAQAGDNIIAYNLDGTLLAPGDALTSSIYDTATEIAEIELNPGQSYRLRLRRDGIDMMETVVLSDQFALADSDGNLDAGEISGLTTAMTWAAFEIADLIPTYTPETALQAALENVQGSSISTLADINKANIEASSLFDDTRKAQMNLIVVAVARVSVHFENNLTLSEEDWQSMTDLLTSITTHQDTNGTSSEAKSLAQDYISTFNDNENLSFIVDPSRLTNQYVDSNIDRSQYITWAQTTDLETLKNLFAAMDAEYE